MKGNKQAPRSANGFLVVAMNPDPLQRFLKDDPDAAKSSRCVILPVSPVKEKKRSLVEILQKRNKLPSSLLVMKDLLSIVASNARSGHSEPNKCGSRVKESLWLLEKCTNYIMRRRRGISLPSSDLNLIRNFFKGPMTEAANKYLADKLVVQKLDGEKFLRVILRTYFDKEQVLRMEKVPVSDKEIPLIVKIEEGRYHIQTQKLLKKLKMPNSANDVTAIRSTLEELGVLTAARRPRFEGKQYRADILDLNKLED
jgi:hypothetical protein